MTLACNAGDENNRKYLQLANHKTLVNSEVFTETTKSLNNLQFRYRSCNKYYDTLIIICTCQHIYNKIGGYFIYIHHTCAFWSNAGRLDANESSNGNTIMF